MTQRNGNFERCTQLTSSQFTPWTSCNYGVHFVSFDGLGLRMRALDVQVQLVALYSSQTEQVGGEKLMI